MSEKDEDLNKGGSGTPNEDGSGAASGKSVEELHAELEALKKANADQFQELKGTKAKLSDFEKAKLKQEEELLKEQGKYKELADKNEQKVNELSSKFKSKIMDGQVKDAAIKAGLRPEVADTFMDLVKNKYADSVSFDEDFNANSGELETFIKNQKDAHSALNFFATDNKPPADGGHGGKQNSKKGTLRDALASIY
ncbi:hypothetical protein [Kangiella sp.]|uniref:hypothetical protein n=1 Tax=Kangiella sp. TaxID=1920245 RepID=UPI003A8D9C84